MSHTSRQRTLLRYYGITEDEYEQLLVAQGGGCAICGKRPEVRRLAVDHSHNSGTTRGLLCYWCNRLLGTIREDINFLVMAVDYLTNPPAISILGREAKGTVERKRRRKRKRKS